MTTRVVHLGSAAWRETPASQRVRIDRRTKWGNPHVIGRDGNRTEVIARFRNDVRGWAPESRAEIVAELRGKTLGCWCAPQPCHGDVLAEIAEGAEP